MNVEHAVMDGDLETEKTVTPIKLLYVEDNDWDRSLFQRIVRRRKLPYEVTLARTLAEARARLAEPGLDIVVADCHLPDGESTALLEEVKDIPFILLTATLEEHLALRTLERGAADYLPKDPQNRHLDALPLTIAKTLRRKKARDRQQRLISELRESEERYRQLFENMLDGFAYCRMLFDDQRQPVDFIFVHVNAAFYTLTGLEQNVEGRRVTEVIPQFRESSPELLELDGRVVMTGQPARLEIDFKPLQRWLSLSIYRPEPGHFAVTFQNITERKHAEQEKRSAREALALANAGLEQRVQQRTAALRKNIGELERFSYALAHDMRAPLRAMRSFSSLLLEDCKERLDEDHRKTLELIGASAERMDHLVLDALDYAKALQEVLPLSDVDADALLREMLQSYPNLHASLADIQIEGPLGVVWANQAGLTQCFSNLLDNAVKFMPPGRRPYVRVYREERSQWARLWFEDNGIGIPPRLHDRIFDIFGQVSKDYDGTGIGLSLVRKVAERMGGRVGVESQPGNGSRFWLELQLAGAGKVMAP